MVSTIRFRSFKTIDLQSRRSYTVVIVLAAVFAAVCEHPAMVLVVVSYAYLLSAFVEIVVGRVRHRGVEPVPSPAAVPEEPPVPRIVEHRPPV
jgi:phosphatidylserine synthase